jgi:phosphopantothenoylcysteine decarboxylase/phosphopantothenate--cysteine ligase
MLEGKTVVLGVTGSIAAYKAVDIASQLSRAGVKVDVVMTEKATRFVSPLSFRAITGRTVTADMFDASSELNVAHIALARAADVVAIAPATANVIAKLATGIADDVLCCTVLATNAPVVIAPAMDANMYENPVTQENVSRLKKRGFVFVGPKFGKLVSGEEGLGRFANTGEIIGVISQVLGRGGSFADRHIVVTAGGTQEFIDPVRIITNRSSGKMGYALAEAARDRGAKVTLITGPTLLTKPVGVEAVDVCTAEEMLQAVRSAISGADVLVMAAAVADYRPKSRAKDKIKKEDAGLTLELERTTDILGEVKGDFIRVGFAAESENLVENATRKLRRKKLDLIVANDVTVKGSGFGTDSNRVTIIGKDGKAESLSLLAKREVADRILDKVVALLANKARR